MTIIHSLFAVLRRLVEILRLPALFALALLPLLSQPTLAQQRAERDGVVLYWGLVPAAIVSEKHALEDMHGVVPKDGGQVHHLVIALFNAADGRRIDDAVVRAQLSEIGIADAPPKFLTPMPIHGQASFGQLFSVAKAGPYRFRIWVKLPNRAEDIEFVIDAASPHVDAK